MNPESSDQTRSPENNDRASAPNEATDRGLRSAALRADQALRTAVDRVRPAAHRVGEWVAPLIQRVLQWLAPLLQRIQEAPAVRRLRERVAPHMEKLPESVRRAPRTRSMQAGAAIAAVGVVGLVIGSAVAGPDETKVDDAAMEAPIQAQHAPAQAGQLIPAPQEAPAHAPAQAGQLIPAPQEAPAHAPAQAEQPIPAPQEAPAPQAQPVPQAPLGPPVEGIDVSNHNGAIDWSKVAADGKKFTFVLATDGTGFSNPRYSEQYHGAKNAGLIAGAYHFARPGSSSAEAQAERFLNIADYQADGKTLPPVLDLEVDPNSGGCYGLSVADMHLWTKTFNDKVKERTGKDPIIYANPSFWRQCMGGTDIFGGHALWLASYGVDSPAVPNGFNAWDFWQYTDQGSVAGIGGNTDLNQYQQGFERLKQLAG
ncbi:lysozyme [Saccharopolyspora pogona]|uniref:lysozyme n=1 Tax=Saccharopolyspora pogona TaxID=333966 RepID=UPI001CC240AD|nr:lysozyme [Saccharopolyspora pogona]